MTSAKPFMQAGIDQGQVPRAERGMLRHKASTYGTSELGTVLECFGAQDGPVDLLLLAAMHGDETESTVVLSEALRRVPENALKNPVVLAVNPDGMMRGTRCNARGVDLNRNWPTKNWSPKPVFHRQHGGGEQDIRLGTGDAARSEAETRALLDLVQRLQPAAIISLHTPLGCIDDPQDSELAHWISRQVSLPVVPDVGYSTPGSFGSWCAEQNIPILTWELPAEPVTRLLASHVPVLYRLITGEFEARPGPAGN